MSKRAIRRREFLRLSAAATSASLLVACFPQQQGTPQASPAETPVTAGKYAVGKLAGPEIVLDSARVPKTFKEAPALAALVQQNRLPAVADRIGQDPIVVKPLQAIGKYGGTLRRAYIGTTDRQNSNRFQAGPDGLLQWDYLGKKVIPNIAKAFEISSDGKVVTLQLRRGMKWSDGAPFTADDIVFWFEDIYLNRQIVPTKSGAMLVNGKDVVVQKVDTYSVRFVSPEPNYIVPQLLASTTEIGSVTAFGLNGLGGYAPKHYLSKFHPKYTPQADVDKLAADAKFNGWVPYFKNRNDWNLNADLPVLTPWKVVKGKELNTANWSWERNPYSIWVDTEGNQLPYIDGVTYSVGENLEVIGLRASAGEYDMQDRHLEVAKLPLFLQNADRSGYKVWLNPSLVTDFGIRINLAYEEDPEIGTLFRTTDFRRALSLGIDRVAINETFFLGTGTPSANVPADDGIYFPGKEWRTKWATLDVAQANSLLDKIGYTQKDGEAYRLRKDGKGRIRLDYQAATGSFADFPAIGEMVKEQWKKIGIDLVVAGVQGTLLVQRTLANQLQLSGHSVGSDDVFLIPDTIVPYNTNNYPGMIGIPYAKWFHSAGKEGKEPFAELKQALDVWKRGYAAPDKDRIEAGKEVYRIHADNVFTIGVVGMGLVTYGIHIAKNTLGNVAERFVNSQVVKAPSTMLPQTFYYK